MPRGLAGTVGAMLAIAVLVPAPQAPAQVPASQLPNQAMPLQQGHFHRLEEMKVELALLSDHVTFPYSIAAAARDDLLELYGFVPNAKVRQRAVDVARRNTSLQVFDTMGIKSSLSLQPSPRSSGMLLREGTELLQKELEETAKQVSLQMGAEGTIVLTGRTDSVENKLEISRIFRKLPGCCCVVNKLAVVPIVRNGQQMVQVTRDGSLFVPTSAVGLDQARPVASSPPPALLLTKSQEEKKSVSPLPTVLPPKQPSPPPKLPAERIVINHVDDYAPSKLPVKWGHPAQSWERQANDLEAMRSPPPNIRQPAQIPTPAAPQPISQQADMPVPIPMPKLPEETSKVQLPAAESKPNRALARSRPNFAETRPLPEPVINQRRLGGSEESEVHRPAAPIASEAPPQPQPSLHSPRRWPPAYVTGPQPNQGRPGVIVFDDELPPPKRALPTGATSRPVVPADLQRQVRSICGREAREVIVTTQRDGTVLVKVLVASRSIEDQLSRKILAMPEMTSPRVRLLMEVEQ